MGTTPPPADPNDSGYSLTNVAEVLFPCLDASGARSVVEIGAYAGDLTRKLVSWAARADARVVAIDPEPLDQLVEMSEQRPELELIRESSKDALRDLPLPDALIIDGDHNYFTVTEELRLIVERTPGDEIPLLMFHDVGWPHGRRDTYYLPSRVPEEHRQPLAENVVLAPWESGVADGGLHYDWAAQREGGPRNGVLTAIEDFVEGREGLRFATVPAFFGLGVLWHREAPWAIAVAAIVEPWDRSSLIERLEAHRVAHLVEQYRHAQELETTRRELETTRRELERRVPQEHLLRAMLGSRAFAWGERLSRLRQGGQPVFSREQVKRALGEEDGQ